jgi:hypothetical protein
MRQTADFRSFFKDRICDLPTHAYLLGKDTSQVLTPLISSHFESDTKSNQSTLIAGSKPPPRNEKLRVALSNVALASHAGSELWTFDTAKYLLTCGFELIVYSPALGAVAERLRSDRINVTSSVNDVESFKPTLLHVNHFQSTAPLVERLKGRLPVINMIHGLLPRPGLPGYVDVDRYCCVSIQAKAKIHVLTGVAWSEIATLPNFFDERRFTEISDPTGGGKALLFSSRTPSEQREQLRAVLSTLGIELDHIGYGGQPTAEPERFLAAYDIIFAVGRSAIEALASGAHVVLWDSGVIGPAVTPDNFWRCVTSNFDLASNVLPWTFIETQEAAPWIRDQVDKINEPGRSHTTRLARTYLPLSAAGSRLLELYHQQLHRFQSKSLYSENSTPGHHG